MKAELKEYSDALEANLEASRNELLAKDLKRKAYYRLQMARENLRQKERELLEDSERIA